MRLLEDRLRVLPSYMRDVQIPAEVMDTSRAHVIEWMIDVHRKFRLLPETLYIAVLVVDRYLSLR